MALTRQDETDLLIALHQGPLETPPWATFLERLRRRTGADYAGMVFRRSDGQPQVTEMASGRQFPDVLKQLYVDEFHRYDPVPHLQLRPERVYALDEFLDLTRPEHRRFVEEFMTPAMIRHSQIMRVTEPSGYEASLVIAREKEAFGAGERALLAALSSHVAVAIRVLASLERERLRAGISGDAISRLNFGWITLDAAGRIVEQDAQAERLLRKSTPLRRTAQGRLAPTSKEAEAALAEVLRQVASGPAPRSRAIHLSDEPWLDMLVTPLKPDAVSSSAVPVLVAYVHGEEQSGAEREDQLMTLFGLTRQEARLALRLSRGRSIAQTAVELGLTLETTRLYSKRIYAKTGTTGQADLVRLILSSVVALV